MPAVQQIARWIAFSALAAASSSACAGALGPTSKASVFISVTIPPRLAVREVASMPASTPAPSEAQSRQFCVMSNGVDRYSVTLLSSQQAMERQAAGAPNDSSLASIAWGGGQSGGTQAQIRQGETVSGFKAGTAGACNPGRFGAAKLRVTSQQSSLPANGIWNPVTVLIAAD